MINYIACIACIGEFLWMFHRFKFVFLCINCINNSLHFTSMFLLNPFFIHMILWCHLIIFLRRNAAVERKLTAKQQFQTIMHFSKKEGWQQNQRTGTFFVGTVLFISKKKKAKCKHQESKVFVYYSYCNMSRNGSVLTFQT